MSLFTPEQIAEIESKSRMIRIARRRPHDPDNAMFLEELELEQREKEPSNE